MKVRLVIECDLKEAALVEEVLKDTAAVIQVQGGEAAPTKSGKGRGYVGGVRNKGISGRDLVMATLTEAGGSVTLKQLEMAFKRYKFAPSSVHSTLSKLQHDKIATRDGNRVSLVKKPKG